LNFLGKFSKNIKVPNFTKILSVVAELFHVDGRTDEQKGMTQLIGAFLNSAKKLQTLSKQKEDQETKIRERMSYIQIAKMKKG
jgi:ubiquitin C-terminal hydrolase